MTKPNDPLARAFSQCNVCGRPLKGARSISFGVGPTCSLNIGMRNAGLLDGGKLAIAQIPFDPKTGDVRCERLSDGTLTGNSRIATNITQAVVWHSPFGFEWGYEGDCPADFALNILNFYLPPVRSQEPCPEALDPLWYSAPVKLQRGGIVSKFASEYHRQFAKEFLATIPYEGGTIKGQDIREWITAKIEAQSNAQGKLFDV